MIAVAETLRPLPLTHEHGCMCADQLTKFLGVNRKTVYEYAMRNEIPHHAPIQRRNVGPFGDGPFRHFDAKTFDDLYACSGQSLAFHLVTPSSEPRRG